MSFKTLHQFTISVDREVEEVTTQVTDGKEVTTKTKTVKPVQVTVLLKEPSRREKQEVALFQTIAYSEAINLGLLPRLVMMQKLAKDPSSPISGEEDRALAAAQTRLQELATVYVGIDSKGESSLTDDDRAHKARIEAEWLTLQRKVIDITSSYQSVFAHTAEQYAQNKVLTWLTLHLSYLKVGPDRYEPLFPGADFKGREDKLADLEDDKDPIYLAAVGRLSKAWMYYFFGHAVKHEDFVSLHEEEEKRELAARKVEEEARAKQAAILTPAAPPVAPEPVAADVPPSS